VATRSKQRSSHDGGRKDRDHRINKQDENLKRPSAASI
jgi:hypothetical protein